MPVPGYRPEPGPESPKSPPNGFTSGIQSDRLTPTESGNQSQLAALLRIEDLLRQILANQTAEQSERRLSELSSVTAGRCGLDYLK